MENRISSARTHPRPNSKWQAVRLAAWCLLLPGAVHGQTAQSQPGKIADAIAQMKSGTFSGYAVEQIAEAHAVQAIPVLEEQFKLSQDAGSKAQIASALVRLGDKDEIYWDYVVEQATEAVNSDIPFPTMYDSQGMAVRRQASPEFIAWAKAHNVPPESAAATALFTLPGKVAFLAETGDPRGIPLLRQALQSHNSLIAAFAAKGLAVIQDKDSIPLIIEACKRVHPDDAVAIADSLIYFDDPGAQSAADLYLPKDYAQAMREARARGNTPFGR
jgi:HEAT repeat protein